MKKQNDQLNKNLIEDTLELIINRLVTPPHSEHKFYNNIQSIYALHVRQPENVNIVTNELFQALLSSLYLTFKSFHYNSYIYDEKSFIQIIKTIVSSSDIILTDDNINTLFCYPFPGLILEQYLQLKNVFSENITLKFLKSSFDVDSYTKYEFKIFIQRIIKEYPDSLTYTEKTLDSAMIHKSSNLIEKFVQKNIAISKKNFEHICEFGNVKLIKLCIKSQDCKLTTSCLEKACGSKNIKVIEFILGNKVTPTANCFTNIFPDNPNNKSRESKQINQCINLLKEYGYKITYDDVILATKNIIALDNFDTLDIKLDKKYMIVCTENGFYPYIQNNIKPDIRCLEIECSKGGNLTNIRKLVASGINLNMKCLENACRIKSNSATVNFIRTTANLFPNIQCVYNIVVSGSSPGTIEKILVPYIQNEKPEKEFKKIIGEYCAYNEIEDELKEEIGQNTKECTPKKINNSQKKISKKVITVIESESESEKSDSSKSRYCSKKTGRSSLGDEIEPDDNLLESIPEEFDFKKNHILNKDLIEILGFQKKKQYSLLDVRKHLMEYITGNELLKKSNIVLDEHLKLFLKNKKINTISVQNIEKIAYMLIKS